ncbi:YhgE/Pip domain-containing protein [Bifidobacterium sp. 82T24]|uniref:YhgE/Pip domain-containing protein n=1 Tax=Bifidobacterium pluvialisilvae TaxID=2834436 RepID=UPI001C56A057|nr:YhgE/Pip domain-containing protein [Bifidobacterium pluvialisilvae]MBW3088326.1 YhgE/Pip domain-containing protein [Bifidobacterium pluvialisilvae]
MRNIWHIFLRDVRNATGNVIGIIVTMGLVIVPSLYAWFNIAASWDPYGNTKDLKVAVASDDAGYKSDLIPVKINVGETVISTLRANRQLDWVFTDSSSAVDGVRSGDYYAAIVIPKSFSADMMTLFSPEVRHTQLKYYLNEKANAIAPHITDQGATTIVSQIDSTFSKTIGEVGIDLMSTLLRYSNSDEMKNYVSTATGHINTMGRQLSGASAQVASYSKLLKASEDIIASTNSLIASSGSSVDGAKKGLNQAVQGVESLDDALGGTADVLNTSLKQSAAGYDAVDKQLDASFDAIGKHSDAAQTQLEALAKRVDTSAGGYDDLIAALEDLQKNDGVGADAAAGKALAAVLDAAKNARQSQKDLAAGLRKAKASLASGVDDAAAQRKTLKQQVASAKKSITTVKDSYEADLKPKLDALASSIGDLNTQTRAVADDLATTVDGLQGVSGDASTSIASIRTLLDRSSKRLAAASDRLQTLSNQLVAFYNNGDPAKLGSLTNVDADTLATLLSSPVKLDRVAVYHIANYGSAMAPFYTILSIWVGSIILVAMMKVAMSDRGRDDIRAMMDDRLVRCRAHHGLPPLRLHEEYFGRYLTFAVMAALQSALVACGDLYYLRVQAIDPMKYLLVCLVSGIVFSNITYTLALSFGDIGKAIAVVLLVMQVAGSGGTFPIETLPPFFQALYPFLPFPHGIAAMHAAMAGSYGTEYWRELVMLALFIIPSLLLGLVLRKPVIRLNDWIIRNLESTKLM